MVEFRIWIEIWVIMRMMTALEKNTCLSQLGHTYCCCQKGLSVYSRMEVVFAFSYCMFCYVRVLPGKPYRDAQRFPGRFWNSAYIHCLPATGSPTKKVIINYWNLFLQYSFWQKRENYTLPTLTLDLWKS